VGSWSGLAVEVRGTDGESVSGEVACGREPSPEVAPSSRAERGRFKGVVGKRVGGRFLGGPLVRSTGANAAQCGSDKGAGLLPGGRKVGVEWAGRRVGARAGELWGGAGGLKGGE